MPAYARKIVTVNVIAIINLNCIRNSVSVVWPTNNRVIIRHANLINEVIKCFKMGFGSRKEREDFSVPPLPHWTLVSFSTVSMGPLSRR